MSTIAEEIQRLKEAKSSIKTSIENKGVTVSETATLDAYPALIDSIASNPTISVRDYGIKFAYSNFYEVPGWADFEGVTDMSRMFYECGNIKTIPLIDTSSVTDMSNMFRNCTSLTTIPQINTSSVTIMAGMFYNCTSLTTIPQIDTSSVTNMNGMFRSCTSLTTIPQINTSSVESMAGMFQICSSLTDLGGFIGLKCNLDLSPCRAITHDSIMNVINKAADVTESPATLQLGRTNLAKITDEEKSIATNKGWTLA